MIDKPQPKRDDKGVPWCGGIKKRCWPGCLWVNYKICLPQVQLDEAELARLQEIVDKLPKCWRLVDGELVQDQPFVPQHVSLWYWTVQGTIIQRGILGSDWSNYQHQWRIDFGTHGSHPVAATACYSTIQAAESAKKENEKETG